MAAYAVAHMRSVNWNASIIEYIQKISRTLEHHDGKFLVHGDNPVVMDGEFKGHLVVIAFPSMEHARSWYFSKEYQEILACVEETRTVQCCWWMVLLRDTALPIS